MICKPCILNFNGNRYKISRDGSVWLVAAPGIAEGTCHAAFPEPDDVARAVRREASRLRRNRNARERNEALRSLGMRKTPYGWE